MKRNIVAIISGIVCLAMFITQTVSSGKCLAIVSSDTTEPKHDAQVESTAQGEQTGNTTQGEQAGNSPEELLAAIAEQIAVLEVRMSYLQSYIKMLSEDIANPSLNREIIKRQVTETSDLEKHMFQVEYNKACLIKIDIESLNRQQTLAEKKLKLEELRVRLGISKQEVVDTLNTTLSDINKQIQLCNAMYNSKTKLLETKKDTPGYEFIGDYKIQALSTLNAKSAEEIKKGMTEYNVSLYICNDQIKQLNDSLPNLKGATKTNVRDQIANLNSQQTLLKKQFEIASESKWSEYISAKAQCDITEMKRPTLLAKLKLLSENYRLGVISGIDKLEGECLLYEELSKTDVAAINLEIAVIGLNAMQKGLEVW